MRSNIEQIILDEARQMAKERYRNHLSFALAILYSNLRSADDKPAAVVAYRLMEEFQERGEGKTNKKRTNTSISG